MTKLVIEIRNRQLRGGRLRVSARTTDPAIQRWREALLRTAIQRGLGELVEAFRTKRVGFGEIAAAVGTLIVADAAPRTRAERFWSHVERKGLDECWLWTRLLDRHGYGRCDKQFIGEIFAHRSAYVDMVGPIPAGLCVLHRCDNPRCCNPAHLFLGTQRDNAWDMYAKGRAPSQKTGTKSSSEPAITPTRSEQ